MSQPDVAPTPRRQFIAILAALAGSSALPAWAEQLQAIGAPKRFDYAVLKGQAQALSLKPYDKPHAVLPKAVEALSPPSLG